MPDAASAPATNIRPDLSAFTFAPAATFDPLWPAFVACACAREAVVAWTGAWTAWLGFAGQLAVEAGSLAWLDTAARSTCEALELSEHAVADRLARSGVTTPLLNDA